MDRADSFSVVKTASGAIFAVHDVAMVPREQNPTKSELCKAVREQAKRKFGLSVKHKKAAMPVALLAAGIRAYHTDSRGEFSIIRLTVACMAAVMWAGCLRYSDMRMIWVGALRFYSTHMVFLLTTRKNDQYSEGDVVYIARGGKHFCPSMRSGGAKVVAQRMSFAKFMRHGHWVTQSAAMRYIQPSTEERVSVTAAAEY
ncbi:hypothetical protein CYMTET_16088 [Cymbomonas tetramitiformis]|uniref:Uncharacterized protein n=1 Tax=Cymbomonas tetramitiformis TaxID=36881 RepID=A0AAE0GCX0_9CHLO|nr:hypothetical protein CYMTET_16088 [Cymbomonas tetramitiformis]